MFFAGLVSCFSLLFLSLSVCHCSSLSAAVIIASTDVSSGLTLVNAPASLTALTQDAVNITFSYPAQTLLSTDSLSFTVNYKATSGSTTSATGKSTVELHTAKRLVAGKSEDTHDTHKTRVSQQFGME